MTGSDAPCPRDSEPEPSAPFPRLHQPHATDDLLSPSVQRHAGERAAAFELKFVVPEESARQLASWAESWMQRDAYADPAAAGSYLTTTLYLDTPACDVFHRSPGFRRRKFRLRRYGLGDTVYLERKSRRQDRVRKRRSHVASDQFSALWNTPDAAPDEVRWFVGRVTELDLRPSCRVSYEREAFVAKGETGPLRVTLDRRIRGLAERGWNLTPVAAAETATSEILDGQVVCEFKFRDALPAVFREAIAQLNLRAGSMSKYRRLMSALLPPADGSHG